MYVCMYVVLNAILMNVTAMKTLARLAIDDENGDFHLQLEYERRKEPEPKP